MPGSSLENVCALYLGRIVKNIAKEKNTTDLMFQYFVISEPGLFINYILSAAITIECRKLAGMYVFMPTPVFLTGRNNIKEI